jgi:N-acetylglucosamine malate deacetylase 1
MKINILALASHPDDAELCTGGTLAKHIALGYTAGIVDFTRGELGTRGSVEIRQQEADRASEILGLSVRENLGFADGFFRNDEEHQRAVIRVIRKYQPDIVLANAIHDRHSDHGRAAELAADACFLSGLAKIETETDGVKQQPWRPRAVYHYIQSQFITPDIIVDISDFWAKKVASYMAYKSQVFDPESTEPQTYISSPHFLKLIEARAVEFGNAIGTQYGEGYTVRRFPGVKNLMDLL